MLNECNSELFKGQFILNVFLHLEKLNVRSTMKLNKTQLYKTLFIPFKLWSCKYDRRNELNNIYNSRKKREACSMRCHIMYWGTELLMWVMQTAIYILYIKAFFSSWTLKIAVAMIYFFNLNLAHISSLSVWEDLPTNVMRLVIYLKRKWVSAFNERLFLNLKLLDI